MAVITALGLGLRVVRLGHLSYWRDEAFTALVSRRPAAEMLDAVRHDSAPPLGYLLSHLAALVSSSPASLRLMSALAGTLAIPVGAALARRAGGQRAGLWAAAVMAVMPGLVASSRDARMYALAGTLVLLSALLLVRALERPSWGRLILYGGAVCLATWAHYLAALAVLVQLVVAAAVLRPRGRALAGAAAAAALGGVTLVPWLLAARAQFQHTGGGYWIQPLTPWAFEEVATQFFRGPREGLTSPLETAIEAATVVAGGVAMLAVAAAVRRGAAPRPERLITILLAGSGLGGLAVLALASLHVPLFDGRYAAVLWAPLVPLLGVGIARLPRAVAGTVVAALAATSLMWVAVIERADWPALGAFLDQHVGPRDEVAADSPDFLLVLFYGNPATVARSHLVGADPPPWYWGVAAYPPGAVQPTVDPDAPTVFLVTAGSADVIPAPPGRHQTAQLCTQATCVTVWTR